MEMGEDKEELLQGIKERMRQKGGMEPFHFYPVMKEDPYLLKDLFQTFSGNQIIDAMLAEEQEQAEGIGVWIRRRGDALPTYTEIYTSEGKKCEENGAETTFFS